MATILGTHPPSPAATHMQIGQITDLIREFGQTLNASNAEVFSLRARTFLLRLLRWHARELGVQDAETSSLWKLLRRFLADDSYAKLRADIAVIVALRNAVAHELDDNVPAKFVAKCAGPARVPEYQSLFDLTDRAKRYRSKDIRTAAAELRKTTVECILSVATFETISRAFIAVLQQAALRGYVSHTNVALLSRELAKYARNKRANLRRAASLLRRVLAYEDMPLPRRKRNPHGAAVVTSGTLDRLPQNLSPSRSDPMSMLLRQCRNRSKGVRRLTAARS